jgi:hypothetical protein
MLAAIRQAGRELVAAGTSPNQALDQLAAQPQRWASIGAAQAQTIGARLAARP